MERAVLVLFIVIGLAVIGVCIMSTLNFLGIQSIKNDLNSLKEKTRLLEQASGIGDVSQVLNEINVEREKIDNLQLFIDTTVMNQIQDNTTQATKANDDLGIFQNLLPRPNHSAHVHFKCFPYFLSYCFHTSSVFSHISIKFRWKFAKFCRKC